MDTNERESGLQNNKSDLTVYRRENGTAQVQLKTADDGTRYKTQYYNLCMTFPFA
jgi:hypothetical protein